MENGKEEVKAPDLSALDISNFTLAEEELQELDHLDLSKLDKKEKEPEIKTDEPVLDKEEKEEEEPEKEESKKEEEEEEEEESLITQLSKQLGVEVNEGEEFEESLEGIAQFTKKASNEMAQAQIEKFFEKFPDVGEFADFVLKGGDPAKYKEQLTKAASIEDYNLEEESDQKAVIKDLLAEQGLSKEKIEAKLKRYEVAGVLEEEAIEAKEALLELHKNKKENLLKEQIEQERLQAEKVKQDWERVTEKIDKSSTLKNITISEKDKEKLKEFISVPDQNGETERIKAWKNMDLETKLFIDLLLMKKVDMKDMISNMATTKNAESLQNKLKTLGTATKPKGGSSSGKEEKPGKPNIVNFNIADLLD